MDATVTVRGSGMGAATVNVSYPHAQLPVIVLEGRTY